MLKLYSTGCPACKAIKGQLEKKNIEYTEVGDELEIIAFADEHGIKNVPFAVLEDGTLLKNNIEIIKYIEGMNE